ncbi:J domain-containing protein [Pirellulales bacterium]|nr:J domain-containing protein [Pirellulales bacterium]
MNTLPDIVPTALSFAALPAVLVIAALHHRTHGRSSPAAAATFVLCGLFLSVLVVIGYFIQYGGGRKAYRSPDEAEVLGAIALCWCFGGVLAALTAAAVTWEHRHQWIIYDEIFPARDYFQESNPDLKTLGLSGDATESDVQQAYLQLAKMHHPDKGGDADEFKRIHAAYCRAVAWTRVRDRSRRRQDTPPNNPTGSESSKIGEDT